MMLLLKNKTFFSPSDDKISHYGTFLQSAVAVEMFFILRDLHSFEAVIAAGDAQTSPRNPGPRAAPRACCWSHCGQDVMGKVLHQRFCLLRLHLQIQNRKCHPFTCLLVLCGLRSGSLQCHHFTFCGGLVSNFTASCGFQGWVSSGL